MSCANQNITQWALFNNCMSVEINSVRADEQLAFLGFELIRPAYCIVKLQSVYLRRDGNVDDAAWRMISQILGAPLKDSITNW